MRDIIPLMRETSKYLICLNEYVTNQMFSVTTCSDIFIILEYIMKRKRDQKKNGENGNISI